ncbi:MAG: hypothetical protein IKO72_09560 [Kiritimatiellae bacterium]|nr:hypothetical protein [Kiritimatiellia bacterium]
MDLAAILSAFEDALELERELGTRTVEIDRALLRMPPPAASASVSAPSAPNGLNGVNGPSAPNGVNGSNGVNGLNGLNAVKGEKDEPSADFAFLLECEPEGEVAELLPKMSAAIGYGPDGVKINDPSARVLIVLGSDALRKWIPGVLARPGQWVQRGDTPALVTASPTKTYRFLGHRPEKIRALKLRLWADLKAALARLGKTPPEQPRKGK